MKRKRRTEAPPLGAVVLAGGASTRMGQPKAWLDFRGRPLLLHVLDQLEPSCSLVYVVGQAGLKLPDLPRFAIRLDDSPEFAGQGPLVGIMTGIQQLGLRGVPLAYLSGCDTPLLTAAHVRFMVDRLAASEGEALIPIQAGTLHPLAGVVRVVPAEIRLLDMFSQAGRRLQDFVAGWPTISAEELPDARVLEPCNDPAQWQRLQTLA